MEAHLLEAASAIRNVSQTSSPDIQLAKIRAALASLAQAENALLSTHPELNLKEVSENSGRNESQKAKTEVDLDDFVDICLLKPSLTNFSIRGTVASKSEVKKWSTARLEGKLFQVTLKDPTGEVLATAFNDDVEEFYGLFQVGKEYVLAGTKVRPGKDALVELSIHKGTRVTAVDSKELRSSSRAFTPVSSPSRSERPIVDGPRNPRDVVRIPDREFETVREEVGVMPRPNPDPLLQELEIDIIADQDFEYSEIFNSESPFAFRRADPDNSHITSYYFTEDDDDDPSSSTANAEKSFESGLENPSKPPIELGRFFQKKK